MKMVKSGWIMTQEHQLMDWIQAERGKRGTKEDIQLLAYAS